MQHQAKVCSSTDELSIQVVYIEEGDPTDDVVGRYVCLFMVGFEEHGGLQGATFGFFHDILVTDNYYIALENPISMDFGKLLTKYTFGRACLAECLTFDNRPTRIHIIPRPGCTTSGGGDDLQLRRYRQCSELRKTASFVSCHSAPASCAVTPLHAVSILMVLQR